MSGMINARKGIQMAFDVRQPNEPSGKQYIGHTWQVWILAVPIGALSGLAGAGLLKLLHIVEYTVYPYSGTFLDAVQSSSAVHRVLVLLIAGILVAGGGILLRQKVAGHGGGLADAIWFRSGEFPLFKTLSRAVLTILVVGMGASLGREGALKQSGASIASSLSDWLHLSSPQRRLLAACGAAGGFAAAYNVPFGGALFGLEVLLGVLSIELAGPVLLTSAVATLTSRLVLPNSVTYTIPQYSSNVALIAWSFAFGPILGLIGAVFVKAFARMEAIEPKGINRVWMPIAVLAGLGVLAIRLPQLLGNGKDIVHMALLGDIPLNLLFVLPILKFLSTGMCLGAGAPGGLFTPTLCVGALIGGMLGTIWDIAWPGSPQGSYALVGMTALLSATTHGPISSVVFAIELTGDWHMVPPLMLASSTATVAARWMDARTIYTARLQRHMREGLAEARASDERDAEFLSKEIELIPSAARYETVVSRLGKLRQGYALFVVDDRGHLLGQISQEELADKVMSLGAPLDLITAGDVAQPSPDVLTAGMGLAEMRKRLLESGAVCLPLIERENRLVGAVTRKSLEES